MHVPFFGLRTSTQEWVVAASFSDRDEVAPASLPAPMRTFAPLLLAVVAGCANFHAVEEGRLYRSAQPDAESMRTWVDRCQIKTVLQLRGADPEPDLAEVVARERIEVVRVPMSARVFPSRAQLVALWDTFAHAEYPMLIHCRAGADRTGLAAAIYVLQRTGDLERARAQLALLYGHTGYGTARLGRVLEMYSRWHGRMDFRRWVTTLYRPPEAFAKREPVADHRAVGSQPRFSPPEGAQ